VEPVERILVINLVVAAQEHAFVLHQTDSSNALSFCDKLNVVARIMKEGRHIAEENSEII
jgi:hypothetical protein